MYYQVLQYLYCFDLPGYRRDTLALLGGFEPLDGVIDDWTTKSLKLVQDDSIFRSASADDLKNPWRDGLDNKPIDDGSGFSNWVPNEDRLFVDGEND